jgi:hypothetical protein
VKKFLSGGGATTSLGCRSIDQTKVGLSNNATKMMRKEISMDRSKRTYVIEIYTNSIYPKAKITHLDYSG